MVWKKLNILSYHGKEAERNLRHYYLPGTSDVAKCRFGCFTRAEADELRKAMGKKLTDKMVALKEKFIAGCQKNGYGPLEKLEQIWSDWVEFSKYAFNKSHATCYSYIAYRTAYLKAHYPSEFMAANLSRNKDDIDEVSKFMDECRSMGINVLGPMSTKVIYFLSQRK
jgi:DNA polymerase-3 subunit alpha